MGMFWAIAAKHRRMGYASEAGRALAKFAFATLRLARIVATTEHENAASIGVMRRMGMTIERNPVDEPIWFQTVGVLVNPQVR
jgi:ribosomal-protein-alanine N-acetyltransferase